MGQYFNQPIIPYKVELRDGKYAIIQNPHLPGETLLSPWAKLSPNTKSVRFPFATLDKARAHMAELAALWEYKAVEKN